MSSQDERNDRESLVSLQKFTDMRGTSSVTSACLNFINSIIGSGIIGLPYSMNQAGLPLGISLLIVVGFITAMISYNIITGDTLTKVFQRIPGVGPDHLFAERNFVIFLTTVLFTLPLSLYRDISKLGKVSLLSVVLTLAILSTVVIRVATFGPKIFMIYSSLKEPTLSTWSRVTHISVGSAMLISLLFATTGYATFTGHTQGDIFENYCRSDDLATFGRFCFGISIITTFPLECFVTRQVVSNVFFNGVLSNTSHVTVTVVIIVVSTVISLAYDCLGVVLELNGVLCAIPLIFIIPSACYLKLSSEPWFQGDKVISCIILLVGVCVMVIDLIMTIMYPQDCSHGVEMFYCFSNFSVLNATLSTTVSVPELLRATHTKAIF